MAKKLIIAIVAIGTIFNFVVYVPKTNAGGVVVDFVNAGINAVSASNTTAMTVKEYILDPLSRIVARTLFNIAVSGIINKIQTGGRDGGPAFVQNWRNFQTDAQYRGENVFRSMLASTTLCDYASAGIKGIFGANQRIPSTGQNLRVGNFDPFALRSACTMPSNFNLASYQSDFSGNGGWNAWSRMLEPQNNYYGLLFGSLDEAGRQRALEESGDMNEVLAGGGYTSIRDKNCAGTGAGAKCVFMGKIFTPGDLLGKSAASTIDNELGWFTSSDELSEVITAIGTSITNRMINLATSNPDKDYKDAPKADDSNTKGYLACINTCPSGKDLSCQQNCAKAWGYSTPTSPCDPSTPGSCDSLAGGGGEGVCTLPATDPHPNHQAEVAAAKASIEAEGVVFSAATPECSADNNNRFEITKRAARLIGGSGNDAAGLLDKPGGNNCQGYSVDFIVFPDGYNYDVLNGTAPDGNGAGWSSDTCLETIDQMSSRYRPAI